MERRMKIFFYSAFFLPIFAYASTERKVVFVHTDVLGTPIAESLETTARPTPTKPSSASIKYINGKIRISWNASSGASSYKVELLKGKNCGEIVNTKITPNVEFSEFDPPTAGDYAARVSACSTQCSSPTTSSTWVNVFLFSPPDTIGLPPTAGACTL